VAVPTPALIVTVPLAFTIVTVLVELSAAFNDALPITKPVAGAVSESPASRVSVTGPVIAVTRFKSVRAAESEVYVACRFGVVLVGLVTVTSISAFAVIAKDSIARHTRRDIVSFLIERIRLN
jgi:hypothetical protein